MSESIRIKKRIQAEYAAYNKRGIKPYDYNGMFTKFLLREGKIIPNKEKWVKDLIPLAVAETENEITSFNERRGQIKTEIDARGVLRAEGVADERLQNNKYQEILRDYFKELKENNINYVFPLEELQ